MVMCKVHLDRSLYGKGRVFNIDNWWL